MQQTAASACPACGRQTAQLYLYSKNGCDIFKCRDCGLGRAVPAASGSEAARFDPAGYYTGGYFSGQHADGYADYLGSEPVLRREFARTVEAIRRRCGGGRLIELGCAYGFFLQEAKPYFEVAGVELAEEAAAHARAAGLDVLTGPADEATLGRLGGANVIVLLDVIEHLSDPAATLRLAARHLDPGGIVVITTGDFSSLYARIAGSHWRLMTPPQHLWFFTPESMRRLADSVGLSVEALDHPGKLVPLSLVLFQLRRMFGLGGKAGGAFGLPVNLFDAMRLVLRKPVQP